MKFGIVSIIGKPNVGKSTLINNILNMHLSITSNKKGTTRNVIDGIYQDSDAKIIFLDTPGVNSYKDKITTLLNRKALNSIENNNIVLFMVDINGFNKQDEIILKRLKSEEKDVILIINKIDKISKDKLLELINEYKEYYDFKEIYPISSLKSKSFTDLINTIKKYLTIVDDIEINDEVTNITTDFYISEIVREKILLNTRDEVPHSVACYVEEKEYKKDSVYIDVVIVVDTLSHKKIVVGHNASMLKKIGIESRIDLEEYFNKKVYLKLFVKVIDDWKNKDSYLKEFKIDE